MNPDAEQEPIDFSDEEALLAEALDASICQGTPQPSDLDSPHGELASVFRLLHDTLGKHREKTPNRPTNGSSDLPVLPKRFRIVAAIGHGGCGTVYRAYDEVLQRVVAIKAIPRRQIDGDDATGIHLREPRAVARLSHPNIIPLYEVISEGEFLCLITEFCEGPTLNTWLSEQNGAVAFDLAAEITLKVSDAVAHAHGRGIVHRDIKPANVLLAPNEDLHEQLSFTPRLTDFGLVRDLRDPASGTLTNELAGTLDYMAPEQIRGGDHVGEATCDVYSLGVMLYRMLTGQLPHRGATAMELMNSICTKTPTHVRLIVPRVPRDLEAICCKCMSIKASDRYASAQALADDLRLWKAGRSVLARPRPVWEECIHVVRSSPIITSMVVGIICLATTASIFLSRSNGQLTLRQKELQKALVESRRNEQNAKEANEIASFAKEDANQQRLKAEANERRALMAAYHADLPRGYEALQRGQFAEARKIASEIKSYANDTLPLATDFQILDAMANSPQHISVHRGAVNEVLIVPHHDIVITAGADGILRFHDSLSGQVMSERIIGNNSSIGALACTTDGKRLAIGYATPVPDQTDEFSNSVLVADWEDWVEQKTLVGYPTTVESLAFSPHGATLAIGCRYRPIHLQSLSAPKDVVVLESDRRHEEIAFSPDGTEVAIYSGQQQLRRFDTVSGEILQDFKSIDQPHHLLWSPDGRWIAISYSNRPQVELLQASDLLLTKYVLAQPFGATQRIAFSPLGKYLVAGLRNGGTVSWNLDMPPPHEEPSQANRPLKISHYQHTVSHGASVSAVAIADDSRVMSGSEDGSVALNGEFHRFFRNPLLQGNLVQVTKLRHDGEVAFLGCANGCLITLNLKTGEAELVIGERPTALSKLALASDDSLLAVGWKSGDVALLALPSYQIVREQGGSSLSRQPSRVLNDLQMDMTGKRLAILRNNGHFELWEWSCDENGVDPSATKVRTVSQVLTLRWAAAISFGLPAEAILHGGMSEEFYSVNPLESSEHLLWTGRGRLNVFLNDYHQKVFYCGYAEGRIEARSPSGILLAECAHSLDPFDSTANSVNVTVFAISPDGKILLSGTREGEVRLWNAKDLRFLGVLHTRDGRGAIASIDFSASGKRLLVHQALSQDAPDCGTILIDLP